eukprot:CAMPEP_0206136620 /NCGR_PEP_ID=MMETSP1473-20131121/1860_1 /ASSEMBLY_ACC=CAM_ASM_001109 /TAXON_ID=1461547 /ORGANISM="Stichococcus sp, Strain RCC1054" /LENGTH=861 /DNA_ID=CAMNT_0053529295 /DNA_START=345 /DNA_END=2930 /DNA_ORIENTATION=+
MAAHQRCPPRHGWRHQLSPLVAVALAAVAAVAWLPDGAAQESGESLSNTLVMTSDGLASALKDATIQEIVVRGTTKLDRSDFMPAPVISRNVTIRGEPGSGAELDMQQERGLIRVARGGVLRFSALQLTDLARAPDGGATASSVIRILALWPTVVKDTGATVELQECTADYQVPNMYNGCAGYQDRLVFQLDQVIGSEFVQQPSDLSVRIVGRHNTTFLSGSTNGEAELVVEDSTFECVQNDGSGNKVALGAGLGVGLGVALLAAIALLAFLLVRRRRRKRREPDDAAGDVEDPPKGASSAQLERQVAGSLTNTPPSGNSLLYSNLGASARSSIRSESDQPSSVLSSSLHMGLLGMRLQHGLEGVEIGPVLGQGSFGCVYKGRWRGSLVAIKVVETRFDNTDDAYSESVLSASIAHPNVVVCFKICLVRMGGKGNSGEYRRPSRSGATSRVSPAGPGEVPPSSSDATTSTGSRGTSGAPGSSKPASPISSPVGSRGAPPGAGSADSGGGGGVGSGGSGGRAGSGDVDDNDKVCLEVLDPAGGADVSEEEPGQLQTWMLLEYCDRGSLEQAIRARRFYKKVDGTLDLLSVCRTLLDIAAGIQYLHSIGIVHADLKPANVLLKSTATDARGFICKLADFGLSRMIAQHTTHLSAATMGTVPYMPPEMLVHQRMSKATDVYSFGVIMNQLYTGQSPFGGLPMPSVLLGVVQQDQRPDTLPETPPAFLDLLTRCWDADSAKRPTFEVIVEEIVAQIKMLSAEAAMRRQTGSAATTSGEIAPSQIAAETAGGSSAATQAAAAQLLPPPVATQGPGDASATVEIQTPGTPQASGPPTPQPLQPQQRQTPPAAAAAAAAAAARTLLHS